MSKASSEVIDDYNAPCRWPEFNNKKDAVCKYKNGRFTEFLDRCGTEVITANKDGRGVTPGVFKEGATRSKATIESYFAVMIDIDDAPRNITAQYIQSKFPFGIDVATTSGNLAPACKEHAARYKRFRVTVKLKHPLPAKDWTAGVNYLVDTYIPELATFVDEKPKTPGGFFYTLRVPEERVKFIERSREIGVWDHLAVNLNTPVTKVLTSQKLSAVIEIPTDLMRIFQNVESNLGDIDVSTMKVSGLEIVKEGWRHDALVSFCGGLSRQGLDVGAWVTKALEFNLERCSPAFPDAEVIATAEDCFQRYNKPVKTISPIKSHSTDGLTVRALEMTKETSSTEIRQLISDTYFSLDEFEQDDVYDIIKSQTGKSKGIIKSVVKDLDSEKKGFEVIHDDFIRDSDNRILDLRANTEKVLKDAGVTLRYNLIKKKIEISVPGVVSSRDNADNVARNEVSDICTSAGLHIGEARINQHVLTIADSNQYNPFVTWVSGEAWDGEIRSDTWYDSIVVEGDEEAQKLKRLVMKRWGLGLLACGYSPDGLNGGGIVLTLVGSQGLGKGTWFASQFPKHLDLYGEGGLDPDSVDSVEQAIGYLLYEMVELDGIVQKTEVEKLRGFITKKLDKFRRPYAPLSSEYPRRTQLGGTVNDASYLTDRTGNRRFATVHAIEIKPLPNDDRWKQQLFRELYERFYQKGERWWLDQKEIKLLAEHNLDYTETDPVQELLLRRYNFDIPTTKWKGSQTATEITGCLGLSQTAKNVKAVTRVVRQLWVEAGEKGDVYKRTNQTRFLRLPARVAS